MIVCLNVRDDEGDEYYIGAVTVPVEPSTGKPLDDVHITLRELWEAWREEVPHPDCDSDFVDWLIHERQWVPVTEEVTSHTFRSVE